ncbi:hypothetical protein [Streptomyces xantholiticus]|nr:hypothetical protein [Streptomyces xantholiticus]
MDPGAGRAARADGLCLGQRVGFPSLGERPVHEAADGALPFLSVLMVSFG